VSILVIDSWRLIEGSFVKCNDLREACGLDYDPKYETEVLIWEQIPSAAVIAEWTWASLERSGIFHCLPFLHKVGRYSSVDSIRGRCFSPFDDFPTQKLATSLTILGMSPSCLTTRQIYMFLLGSKIGYRVTREFDSIDKLLSTRCAGSLEEFDRAAHEIALRKGRRAFNQLYRDGTWSNRVYPWMYPHIKTDRLWRKALADSRCRLVCPNSESWWSQRAEADCQLWEAYALIDHDPYGLKNWMMRQET